MRIMAEVASLSLNDEEFKLPIIIGSEGEMAIDTRKLRKESGYICYDQGYGNTGSCQSKITFLDGDKGILRHRGYPIEQLTEHSDFLATAFLAIYGEIPTEQQRSDFSTA